MLQSHPPGDSVRDQRLRQFVSHDGVQQKQLVDTLHGVFDRNRIKQIADGNLDAGGQFAFFRLPASQHPDHCSALEQLLDHFASDVSRTANCQNLHRNVLSFITSMYALLNRFDPPI